MLLLVGATAVMSPWLFHKQAAIPLIIIPGAAVLALGVAAGVVGVLLMRGGRQV